MLRPGWERLQRLVAAECLEGKGRFIKAIEVQVLDLATQPSWVLPAHDRNEEVIDGKAQYIELRSANLVSDIALTLEWFGDKLDPAVRGSIETALKQNQPHAMPSWLNSTLSASLPTSGHGVRNPDPPLALGRRNSPPPVPEGAIGMPDPAHQLMFTPRVSTWVKVG